MGTVDQMRDNFMAFAAEVGVGVSNFEGGSVFGKDFQAEEDFIFDGPFGFCQQSEGYIEESFFFFIFIGDVVCHSDIAEF